MFYFTGIGNIFPVILLLQIGALTTPMQILALTVFSLNLLAYIVCATLNMLDYKKHGLLAPLPLCNVTMILLSIPLSLSFASLTSFSYSMCLIPIGLTYLASYLLDYLNKEHDENCKTIPIGTALRMSTLYTILIVASANYGIAFFIFTLALPVSLLNLGLLVLQTGYFIDRATYQPVPCKQDLHIAIYMLTQVLLGCLATLDVNLLMQNPINYIRQIFAHFKGAFIPPCMFICKLNLNPTQYSEPQDTIDRSDVKEYARSAPQDAFFKTSTT